MKSLKSVLALSVLAAGLSACGGDDGDSITIVESETPTPTETPTPDITQTPAPTTAMGCEDVVEADFVSFNNDCSIGTLAGTIDSDYTLLSGITWYLSGEVLVGEGNVFLSSDADVQAVIDAGVDLTIEPGTNIQAFDTGSLFVTRGSRLIADGSAEEPITFSSIDLGLDGSSEWGGIIIQGFAPHYGQGGTGACFSDGAICNVQGEGGSNVGFFGGDVPDDDSGVIRYVRIAEGGFAAGPGDEINGLTFQGVGHGTTVEYVQVHGNLDDGIEWFGGTVNAKYLVLTSNDDDDIDFDEGYQGNIQYAIVQKDQTRTTTIGDNDPRGIEANSSDEDFTEETRAVLANITLVGSEVSSGEPGMRLRGALTVDIYNSSVQGFGAGCIRIDDATFTPEGGSETTLLSDVALTNILNDCDGVIYSHEEADAEVNVIEDSLSYSGTFAIEQASAVLASAPTITAIDNGSGFEFDQTDYVGAVDPAATEAWWDGWILEGTLQVGADVDTTADFVTCEDDLSSCIVTGVIDQDYTFTRGVEWRLSGEVLVGQGNVELTSDADVTAVKDAGVTLTVESGADVRALSNGSLFVTRGSTLVALGTEGSPITFSSIDDDFDGSGEWGGLIIQGFAPQYGQGGTGPCFDTGTICNVQGEGGDNVGFFAGNDEADDSGIVRYVRIAEGGFAVGPGDEINGLTLQGVGYGTTVEYVQVHGNLDDGVEWFGGTVNAKYLVLTNNDDDDIDYDEGYQGNIQYAIVRKNPLISAPIGDNDPRGIEANSSDEDFVEETNATIANVLLIGSDVSAAEPGMRLRGALTTSIYNSAVSSFDTGCVRIDDANFTPDGGVATTVESDVTLVNAIGDCLDGFYTHETADSETNAGAGTVTLDDAYALTDTAASVTAPTIVPVDNGSGFTFDNTDFVGAVEPGTSADEAWWANWIIDGSL